MALATEQLLRSSCCPIPPSVSPGPHGPPGLLPGAVETVTLETKHKHLTRCHPRLSHSTASSSLLPTPSPKSNSWCPPSQPHSHLWGIACPRAKLGLGFTCSHLRTSRDGDLWRKLQGGITVPSPMTLGRPHCRESHPEQSPARQHYHSPYPQTSEIKSQTGAGRGRRSCFALCAKGQAGVLCLAHLSH